MIKYLIPCLVSILFLSCSPNHLHDESRIVNAITNKRTIALDGPQFMCTSISDKEFRQRMGEDKPANISAAVFNVKGFCPGDKYSLYAVRLNDTATYYGDFVVNKKCELVNVENSSMCLSDKVVMHLDFMRGEEMRYVLIGKNNEFDIVTNVIPFPIQTSWEDGANVSISALDGDMSLFSLEGVGFNVNEEVHMTSNSCGEILSGVLKASSKGIITTILLPGVEGTKGGSCKIKLGRKITGEERSLEFLHGDKARLKTSERRATK